MAECLVGRDPDPVNRILQAKGREGRQRLRPWKCGVFANTSHLAQLRNRCAAALQNAPPRVANIRAFVGFDGFVDEIVHVVDRRHDASRYDRVPTLTRFGERVVAAAGKSTNIEGVVQQVKLHALVVHPVSYALAVREGTLVEVEGPVEPNPKITTGAGDHFNAGFCLGMRLGLDLAAALLMGVTTSGFYVRQARSPSRSPISRRC